MFTGIVECSGTVKCIIESGTNIDLIVESPISGELKIDQSVAHNGVCLTVVAIGDGSHTVTIVNESLLRSNLGQLEEGNQINLERCLKLGDRVDGHMVQGHVDATVKCLKVADEQGSWRFTFQLPLEPELLVQKGSICLNGVSLTIAELDEHGFSVAIIPYTFEHTCFKGIASGDLVNVEYDILGKYVQRQLTAQKI